MGICDSSFKSNKNSDESNGSNLTLKIENSLNQNDESKNFFDGNSKNNGIRSIASMKAFNDETFNIIDISKFEEESRKNNINKNTYIIYSSNILGKGGFGIVYFGKHYTTDQNVAIKIEPKRPGFSYLLNEYRVYYNLSNYEQIPKIYNCSESGNNNVLIMELLGDSLETTFKKFNKKFSLSTVLNIGIQIINILEYVHNKDYIHRDIKPDSFLLGIGRETSKIYIIDFGMAIKYKNPVTGYHNPPIKGSGFIGTYKFSSNNSFIGYNKSRRDDIESVGYILVYFLKGFLPWEGTNSFDNIKKIRLSTTIDTLCEGLPLEIKEFIKYSQNLSFIETPNYNYLRDLLNNIAKNNNIILTKNNYDWILDKQIKKIEKTNFKKLNDLEFINLSGVANSCVGNDDKKLINKEYIKSQKSFVINNILRTKGILGLNEEQYKLFYILNKVIKSLNTEEDYMAYRYVDNNYIKSVFLFNPTTDINYNISKIKEQIGTIKIEKGFMSCFMTNKHIIERNIILQIKIPKGTNAYITDNKDESEIILNCNTEYQILDALLYNKDIIQINVCIINHHLKFYFHLLIYLFVHLYFHYLLIIYHNHLLIDYNHHLIYFFLLHYYYLNYKFLSLNYYFHLLIHLFLYLILLDLL